MPQTVKVEIIRPGPEHLDGAIRCLRTYNLRPLGESDVLDPDYETTDILHVRNRINPVRFDRRCFAALRDGEVAGFCSWAWYDEPSREAKTQLFVVHPDHRSLGIGRMLQKRRMDDMREAGARCVHTFSDEPGAIRWYQEKFGYRLLEHVPVRHAVHRFIAGDREALVIHRAFRESESLAHLLLEWEP